MDVNPYDLYAGIDVQENGYATDVKWDLFTDKEGKPLTSLGLYVPSWTYASSSSPDEFQEKENIFGLTMSKMRQKVNYQKQRNGQESQLLLLNKQLLPVYHSQQIST